MTSKSSTRQSSLPLDGVRILAVEHVIALPYCTMLMADYGAEVIKIEVPGKGDEARTHGQIMTGPDGVTICASFVRANRGKKSVTIDLKKPAGRDLFLDLTREANVVVDNLDPKAMDRLGLGFDTLKSANPRIIYLSVSGFGHDDVLPGPYSHWPAYGPVGEAAAGVSYTRGFDDRPPITSQRQASGDLPAAYLSAFGLMLALRQVERTGEGQRVDMALADCQMSMNEMPIMVYTTAGRIMERGAANQQSSGAFSCKDGYLTIVALEPRQWEGLCRAIERPDLLGMAPDRVDPARAYPSGDVDTPRAAIEEWTSRRTKQEAAAHLADHGVPAAPVRDAKEVVEDPHVAAREMMIEIPHAAGGTVKVVGNPVKMKGLKPRYGSVPALGSDTEDVLESVLGMDGPSITRLRDQQVI